MTLAGVANKPDRFTTHLQTASGENIIFRPLLHEDQERLTDFLESLSEETRHFWTLNSYDNSMAEELCVAIAKYDKLRMVAVTTDQTSPSILAILEIAFHLGGDDDRFQSYGIELNANETCRFGPCVRDSEQGGGLASLLMPPLFELIKRFGMQQVILWGGVMQANRRAIKFYLKHDFQYAGEFDSPQTGAIFDMFRPTL